MYYNQRKVVRDGQRKARRRKRKLNQPPPPTYIESHAVQVGYYLQRKLERCKKIPTPGVGDNDVSLVYCNGLHMTASGTRFVMTGDDGFRYTISIDVEPIE